MKKKNKLIGFSFVLFLIINSCSTLSVYDIEKIKFEIISNDIISHHLISEENIRNFKIGDKIIWELKNHNRKIILGKEIKKVDYFDVRGIYYLYNQDKSVDTLLMDHYGRILYKNNFYKGSEETKFRLRNGIINFPSESKFELMKKIYNSKSSSLKALEKH